MDTIPHLQKLPYGPAGFVARCVWLAMLNFALCGALVGGIYAASIFWLLGGPYGMLIGIILGLGIGAPFGLVAGGLLYAGGPRLAEALFLRAGAPWRRGLLTLALCLLTLGLALIANGWLNGMGPGRMINMINSLLSNRITFIETIIVLAPPVGATGCAVRVTNQLLDWYRGLIVPLAPPAALVAVADGF